MRMRVHLGLREAHRQAQLAMLAEWVNELTGRRTGIGGVFQ